MHASLTSFVRKSVPGKILEPIIFSTPLGIVKKDGGQGGIIRQKPKHPENQQSKQVTLKPAVA